MPVININSDAVVVFTNKLEKLRKYDLPIAVMQTLNSAAFDVKQKTMPVTSKEFTNRSPNFFKANSTVMKASGFKVRSMKSTVGFASHKLRLGASNFAVKDLEEQENGGLIDGKSFIPLDAARRSGSKSLVKPAHRLTNIKNIVNQNSFRGNKKQKFIKAIHKAGKGGHVLGGTKFGETTLFRVRTLTKRGKFTVTPLYSFKSGRKVKVKPTPFMKMASGKSAAKMEGFFIKHAKGRFLKALR